MGKGAEKSPCDCSCLPPSMCHPQFSASSTTILDEEPIVNRGLAAALLLCQNKGAGLGGWVLWQGRAGWVLSGEADVAQHP